MSTLILANDDLAWHLDVSNGKLRSSGFENRLSGRFFFLSQAREMALVLSARPDHRAQPYRRVDDFQAREVRQEDAQQAAIRLRSASAGIEADLHYRLEGPTRRKWAEVRNTTGEPLLLLDIELDVFLLDGALSGGGQGQPLFAADEVFLALEHPAGWSEGEEGRVRLRHHPGRRLTPGESIRSQTALVSVAPPGRALEHFVSSIEASSRRQRRIVSIYTPFGINNQWGGCPTLDDEQTLAVLDRLEEWQAKGVRFDYFTLDTGWVDPASDLKRFRPLAYPEGPHAVVERVRALGMGFGLWFATSWGAESCWDHPPAWELQSPPAMTWRNGYPSKADFGGMFCLACDPYFHLLRDAVLHHLRENQVRFLKFDGGHYACDREAHGHLPGRYSTERMYDRLIELADRARKAAPDVFIMWYWGLRSPFWALHGDMIFESGLPMEGSGTSASPALYYRDSVTLAQDQNARFARTIPPLVKDSLGVWLADTRWGNYMARERWREALVMDLGRGNLLFPNLWGNLDHLDEEDVGFLARMIALAREKEALLLQPRRSLGDPWGTEAYGHGYFQGARGLLFLNNVHFSARPIELPLEGAQAGTPLRLVSHFPERQRLLRADGSGFAAGETAQIWLRPFEVLLLEVTPSCEGIDALPARPLSRQRAEALGMPLALERAPLPADLDVRFADAARFESMGLVKKARAFETVLPDLEGEPPILAVSVRLRKSEDEWRYSPAVAEIVQVRARLGGQRVQLAPVPDARQFGNTQKAGCSWILYKLRLGRRWSLQPLRLAVHAWLPAETEARIEAWIVRRWWREDARPVADGYYAEAPS